MTEAKRTRRKAIATLDAGVDPKGPARLLVLTAPGAGTVHPVPEEGHVVIGRSHQCDFVVVATDVSRQHAQIRRSPTGGLVVEDLGSSNGTFVNGKPVEQPTRIRFGDQIVLGTHCVLLFTHYDSAEEQLLEQQRLELLGRMAAGVAHDLNNVLGAVLATKDYLASLSQDVRLGSKEVRECLGDIDVAACRATDLIPQLLHFARGSDTGRKRLDLSELCREIAQLARRIFDRRILVEERIAPNLAIMGDRGQVHQILMNLAVNARDAMPFGGRLTIETRPAEPAEIARMRLRPHQSHVMVVVTDTGQGIDGATKERIFEPFFTTKSGKGFGLGLATARQLLAAHAGAIDLDSDLGAGTSFRICLPAAERTAQVHRTAHELSALAQRIGPRRLLLVDDDESFGKATGRLLKSLGHRVDRVTSGRDAIHAFRAHGHDVILLDLDMADLCGEDVLELVRREPRDVRVVVMSGHGCGERIDTLRRNYPSITLLAKPMSVDELQLAIQSARVLNEEITGQHTLVRSPPAKGST